MTQEQKAEKVRLRMIRVNAAKKQKLEENLSETEITEATKAAAKQQAVKEASSRVHSSKRVVVRIDEEEESVTFGSSDITDTSEMQTDTTETHSTEVWSFCRSASVIQLLRFIAFIHVAMSQTISPRHCITLV